MYTFLLFFHQGKQPSITGTKSLSAGSKHRLSATKHLQAFPSPRSEAGVTDVTADDVLVAELLCKFFLL